MYLWKKLLPRVYHAFFGNHPSLLPTQQSAIPLILEGKNILLIAPTGAGKTEAVVAPLAERALDYKNKTYAIYIVPTRALANDLEVRLKERLDRCGLRLAIRHGERNTIAGKQAPAFILTTPESLEVMLSTCPKYAIDRLKEVRAVVVDEVHQFYGTRRGLQLAFLLERLKDHTKTPLQRIGLSATVANPEKVAQFLQGSDYPVKVVSIAGQRELDVYLTLVGGSNPEKFSNHISNWLNEIFSNHRKVLLFANTRNICDWLCWQLSEKLSVPVLLHYSSLHRDYREWVERTFRQAKRAICIATSTLELGIDIGDIDAIVMWGAPHSVTSFLQRLGRGNRRTNISTVYAACPMCHPSGEPEDPDDHLLRFLALTYCSKNSELETKSEAKYYSVLLQQLLVLCRRYSCVAPDALLKIANYFLTFCNEETLTSILNVLVEKGVLKYDIRQNLWLPTDKFYYWLQKGLFWSNIGGQESAIVIGEKEEHSIPLAEIPSQSARGLSPGKIVVLAGKPRLITRLEKQAVWVTDLQRDEAELVKYFAPPEPTPQTVAQAIRNILWMREEEMRELPIKYDEWSLSRVRWWRQYFQDKDKTKWFGDWFHGRWTLFTFAGSIINWLLEDLLKELTGDSVHSDAWRITLSKEIYLDKILSNINEKALEELVIKRWNNYLNRFSLPNLFFWLPAELQRKEIFSMLELKKVVDYIKINCKNI